MKVVVSFFKKLVGMERLGAILLGVWWMCRLVGVLECLFQCKIWFSHCEIFFILKFLNDVSVIIIWPLIISLCEVC